MDDGSGTTSEVVERRRILVEVGAAGATIDELLAFNRCRIDPTRMAPSGTLPLADEAHVVAWQGYLESARSGGVFTALKERLVQFCFPVRAGMSSDEAYLRATRRGVVPDCDPDGGLVLRRSEALELALHHSLAGVVPVLATPERDDFVALVRALSGRNEPIPVPDSMGACLVSGLNNWDRVRTYRRRWEAVDPSRRGEAAWSEEFGRLAARKELYQDRIIILSRGEYSGVSAADAGFSEAAWLEHSFSIRREHECTHYFSLRVFGGLQHNVLEELVADFVGIVATFGRYRGDLARRFLGLESYPAYRNGGRLENYRGTPPLSDAAFAVLQRLVWRAVDNLRRLDENRPRAGGAPGDLARLVYAITPLTLEELAASDGAELAERRLEASPGEAS